MLPEQADPQLRLQRPRNKQHSEGRFRTERMCLSVCAWGWCETQSPGTVALQCGDDSEPVTGNFRGQGWDSLCRTVFVTEEFGV